jgi:hypothetical protein
MDSKFQQVYLKIMEDVSNSSVFPTGITGGSSLLDPNTPIKPLMSNFKYKKKISSKKEKSTPAMYIARRNLKGMPKL